MFEKHCLNCDPVKLPSWSENCPAREIVQRKIVPQQIPLDLGYGKARDRVGDNLTGSNFPCTVLNARKHFQNFHSFMVNVLIWQFHNSNCSYSLITVIFYKSNCKHLYLQMRLWKATFSKELLFRSTYSLNFLSNYCSFWEQLLLRRSIWNIKFL